MHYHMEVVCLLSGPNMSWGHKYVTQGMCCDLLTEGEKNKAWSTWYTEVDSWRITSLLYRVAKKEISMVGKTVGNAHGYTGKNIDHIYDCI